MIPYRLRKSLTYVYTLGRVVVDFMTPRPRAASDGIPLPPSSLRRLVAGTDNVDWFLSGGHAAVADLLPFAGVSDSARILDFGCGCGRVARVWQQHLNVSIVGVDTNLLAVLWCKRRLSFGMFRHCSLDAPLPFRDGEFDFAYALSVLTHLSTKFQMNALEELRRVLKPDGRLAVSLHGEACTAVLSPSLMQTFERGEIVVTHYGVEGSNLVNSFHSFEAAAKLFSRDFMIEAFVPSGATGNPPQDLYILRRR